ncbi:hypothetical protein BJ138DRAFT_511043 [Hygrophoropsis aurantiaca]|uniref:Uncharacterized protein n=1 Tax=Hygrophoropsis aurantiaca TaxID=72124 RepID=A0ACB8A274_9AGAM|nr:hypothetical protein BJ138DRAFT_511043 [Hygrophoropsis aurantiaca]
MYDRSVWAHAYRTSSLVRPAGPFAWQTTHMVESNLTQSARLSLNWSPNDDAAPIRSCLKNIATRRSAQPVLSRWLFVIQDQCALCATTWTAQMAFRPRSRIPFCMNVTGRTACSESCNMHKTSSVRGPEMRIIRRCCPARISLHRAPACALPPRLALHIYSAQQTLARIAITIGKQTKGRWRQRALLFCAISPKAREYID